MAKNYKFVGSPVASAYSKKPCTREDRDGCVASPSEGLDPSGLHENVASKTCGIFGEPKYNDEGVMTAGRGYKGSCPITWTWKEGKPALRFCHGKGKAGRIIPVEDSYDAMQKASEICVKWQSRAAKISTDARGLSKEFASEALAMSDSDDLSQYTLGRVRRAKRKSRRQR